MAKKAYIGVDDVAHKIKKGYIGVDGIARRIKKVYIGIGGVARPCWGSGVLSRYGNIEKLGVDRTNLAGASVGRYALFAGGNLNRNASSYYVGQYSDVLDAYDASLTHSEPTMALTRARDTLVGASLGGEYALFAGGGYYDSSTGYYEDSNAVDAYDKSLTRIQGVQNLPTPRMNIKATTIGDYALFTGGFSSGATEVTAYSKQSLSQIVCDAMSDGKRDHAAASIGEYALIAGGATSAGSITNVVYAYDKSLTRSIPTTLSSARYQLAGTSVDDYALFAGGYTTSRSKVIDVYDRSLTRSNPISLTYSVSSPIAVTVQGYALFADGSGGSKLVQAFDSALTNIVTDILEDGKDYGGGAAASVGDYALFAGGDGVNDLVEAYVVN